MAFICGTEAEVDRDWKVQTSPTEIAAFWERDQIHQYRHEGSWDTGQECRSLDYVTMEVSIRGDDGLWWSWLPNWTQNWEFPAFWELGIWVLSTAMMAVWTPSQALPGCVAMRVLWTLVPLGSKTQGALRSNLMINSGYIGCQMSKNMKQMGLIL